MAAGFVDQAVDHSEVKLPFLGFDQLPGNGSQESVETQCDHPFPDGLHVGQARRTGVVQLSADDQERLPVDDQLRCAALLPKMWDGFRIRW